MVAAVDSYQLDNLEEYKHLLTGTFQILQVDCYPQVCYPQSRKHILTKTLNQSYFTSFTSVGCFAYITLILDSSTSWLTLILESGLFYS